MTNSLDCWNSTLITSVDTSDGGESKECAQNTQDSELEQTAEFELVVVLKWVQILVSCIAKEELNAIRELHAMQEQSISFMI